IEGSVVQDDIIRETVDFYSYYFGNEVPCRKIRSNHNDEGDIDPLFPLISIFNQNGRGSKKCGKQDFTTMEIQLVVTHILLNFIEIQSYINLFVNTWGNEAIYTRFSKWLKKYFHFRLRIPRHIILSTVDQLVLASSTSQSLPPQRLDDQPLEAYCRAQPLFPGTPSASPSPIGTSLQLSVMRIINSCSDRSNNMAGMPPLTYHYRERLGRVMIYTDGSPWIFLKDGARALKECIVCAWEPRYNMVIATTLERRACTILSSWLKKVWDTDQCPRCLVANRGCKSVGMITREMENEFGRTTLELEVFKRTYEGHTMAKSMVEAFRTMYDDSEGLEGIRSSPQAEALDGVQIATMLNYIVKLTEALA
ncbi:hypothetical protein H5410_036383, partial [Solanum commersonii]